MNISVFGLGYVGSVSAACLERDRQHVVGVDTAASNVALINQGQTPVIEAKVNDLIAQCVQQGRLRAVAKRGKAVAHGDLLTICVGTPSRDNGSLDLKFVRYVCAQIGGGLAEER